jgi:hypothetical protein
VTAPDDDGSGTTLVEFVARPAPEFPKVITIGGDRYLEVQAGREYRINDDPLKFLGLIHHLTEKNWVDRKFVRLAVTRVSQAMRWPIHI